MKSGFSHVGPTLCGIVAALVVAFAAAPAHADDGTPAVPDATSIASTVAAAVDAIDVAPSSTAPAIATPSSAATDPVSTTTDSTPSQAVPTPVVPPSSTPILPAIPAADTPAAPAPDPAPTGLATPLAQATEPVAAPVTAPSAPQTTPSSPPASPPTTTAPAPAQSDIPAAAGSPAPDTANTTLNNSNGIRPTTPASSTLQPDIASQTFIWNWNWNCDPGSTPTLPGLPPGTTTIVWNWHWSCPDAPPPTLDVAGVTICTSCNIAISVRLASPGDDGDLTQSIAAQAAATVNEVAAAVQQVAQVVPPPLPPALPPASAGGSSAPVDAFTSAPAAALDASTVQEGQIDNGPVTPTVAPGLDETPRHGSDALLASWVSGATAAPQRRSSVLGSWRARGTQELRAPALQRAPLVLVELTRASSAADQGHHSGGAGPATTRSLPPPVPAPSPDAPLSTLVAMAPAGPPQPAGSGVVALATGGLGLFLLFFASYLVPLSRAVRARAGVAEPHPPG